MKTFKLSLLFLLIPFISKGQQCEDNFVSVIAVVSQTNLESNFMGVLEIYKENAAAMMGDGQYFGS